MPAVPAVPTMPAVSAVPAPARYTVSLAGDASDVRAAQRLRHADFNVADLYVPRVLCRLAALTAVLCAGIVLSPLAARCAPGRRAALVRIWCRALVRSLGVRIQVSGALPRTGGVLIVANHISWLDIPVLAAVRPARMLAKSEIRGWPIAGALAVRGHTLFIARESPRALPGTVARIAAALREGSAVTAFPEGSTWCGRGQGRFRRAVFQAALDAGVPVRPVHIG